MVAVVVVVGVELMNEVSCLAIVWSVRQVTYDGMECDMVSRRVHTG